MTTQQETVTYSYDRQGNMLSDGRNQYTYDDFGRLVLAVTAEGGIQKNCYDAEGLRTEMEENGRLVQFLYNEDREVVAEKDYSGNIIRYIRGLGLISSDSENAKTYYHYVSDEQGSVSHIIRGEDKESGVSEQGREQDRILNQYEYDVFGNTISCEERVANRFRYQGEQYDPVTRQYYLRARYYNPVIGRFTQEDTYYGDGLNLYEYCRNNTITYKDPTGHNICPTQRDLYHKYKEEGMSPQEAYQKMRKELGLDSKSGYKDSGVGNGKDPWRSYESGKTSNGLPDWLKARFEAGNSFNKENRPRYPYNEVEVYGDGKNYVVDSYIPGSEIVSRKFTQLASVKESTGIGYLNELQKKYPSGAIITDSPFNPKVLREKTMTGNLILEIPEQKGPIPQSVIDYANNKGIIIRDVNGKEYN